MEEETGSDSIIDAESKRLRVMADKCATCVFRPGNLMALEPGVLARIVNQNNERGAWLTCHATLPYGANPGFGQAVCHGYFIAHKKNSQGLQLAERLIGFHEVDPPPDSRNR
ncbi:hypothetical protein ACIOEX_10545 [Streptomyces sp. NPDC087850]|uniref:hypothetical protein n=1 Tax=Streptomyces sp. NPDC087850 TaxID=3365809 RepID=UPI0038183528